MNTRSIMITTPIRVINNKTEFERLAMAFGVEVLENDDGELKLYHDGNGYVFDLNGIDVDMYEEEFEMMKEEDIDDILELIQKYMSPLDNDDNVQEVIFKNITNTGIRNIHGYSALITKEIIEDKSLHQ